MTVLEDIKNGAQLRGVVPGQPVEVVSVEWIGDQAINLVYRVPGGGVAETTLYRDDQARIELDARGRAWSFDADGDLLRLVTEANRIKLAHYFDPYLAIHTSLVDPLPHQISAVYGEMLPRQPLRFLLADDPGAGKTIMTDLIERYCAEHLPKLSARSAADQRSALGKMVEPVWGRKLVTEITPTDVDKLLTKVAEGRARPHKEKPNNRARKLQGAKPTPVRANRIGEVLRKMFTLAVQWGWCEDNPAQRFHRRTETPRERFLSKDEIAKLAAALEAAEDRRAADIIRMCMLTGARLGEVRQARFEQLNLEHMSWSKPPAMTKQRRAHRVPISDETAAIVRQRRLLVPKGSPWLFPGDTPGQPVQEVRRFWAQVQKQCGLQDVRIHDLRHTFASLLVSGGASLEMIGKLLGHSQMQTTLRYAHLMDSPLRAGVDAVASAFRPKPRLVHDADNQGGGKSA